MKFLQLISAALLVITLGCLFGLYLILSDKVEKLSFDIKEIRAPIAEQVQECPSFVDAAESITEWSLESCDTSIITSNGNTKMMINCFYNKQ